MTTYHAINMTGNTKTGPIPVTTSSKDTCPDTCPLKEKGCYAKYSFLGAFWTRLTAGEVKTSLDHSGYIKAIQRLPEGALWRDKQAGDQEHINGVIDSRKLRAKIKANRGKRGFTYTHHSMDISKNRELISYANDNGFTINLSANSLNEADQLSALEIGPVVTLLPVGAPKVSVTPEGRKVVRCPADSKRGITCATCALCARSDRDFIIGFEAHGSAKKSVSIIATDAA